MARQVWRHVSYGFGFEGERKVSSSRQCAISWEADDIFLGRRPVWRQ